MCVHAVGYAYQPLHLWPCPVFCVSVCHVCVHWGWGMWVEQILKMESFFVGAASDSRGRHSNTPHFPQSPTPHPRPSPPPLSPLGRAAGSHLSNKQVNGRGATASVHRDARALPRRLVFLPVTRPAQGALAVCLPTGSASCHFFLPCLTCI